MDVAQLMHSMGLLHRISRVGTVTKWLSYLYGLSAWSSCASHRILLSLGLPFRKKGVIIISSQGCWRGSVRECV